MNVSIESPGPTWHEGPEVEPESLYNFLNISSFKITCGPLIIGHALDNQSAPIGRKVKRFTAHGARGVRRTRALPTVNTPLVERVTTGQRPIRLMGHGSETHGTLWALVDPAPFLTLRDFASARGPVGRLGTTSSGLHYLGPVLSFNGTAALLPPRPRGNGLRPGTSRVCYPRRAYGRLRWGHRPAPCGTGGTRCSSRTRS